MSALDLLAPADATPESIVLPEDDMHPYVYVLIRKDLELHQQLVQSSHAAFEAGLRWHSPGAEVASLIVLEVPHKAALLRAARKFSGLGIEHHTFFEPDFEMGESALATRPLIGADRKPLAGYPLWKHRVPAATPTSQPSLEST